MIYSNHLNTNPEYLIYLNTGQYGFLVFKWLSPVTWLTIQIPDHHQAYYSPVFRPPFNLLTNGKSDTNLPFEYRLVQYFNDYCKSLVNLGPTCLFSCEVISIIFFSWVTKRVKESIQKLLISNMYCLVRTSTVTLTTEGI